MRVIKIYTVDVSSANHYLDTNYEHFYSLDDALRYLLDFAEDWRDYKDHGYNCPEAVDVGYLCCNLVPIKDGISLPDDPTDIFSDFVGVDDDGNPIYLADERFVACSVEHELPYGGVFMEIFADGHSESSPFRGKRQKDHEAIISDWKSHGWDGTVEEVVL